MFPKILHQTWKTTDLSEVPEFECCSRSWRRHHPDWEYRLWDDRANAAFVEKKFNEHFKVWAAFDKNIKRLDSIRFMWMYEYGGVYADLDMECLRSLAPLIELHQDSDVLLFCDFDPYGTCISANPALIVSRPGSGFWLEMLDYEREHRDEHVMQCNGPDALAVVARRDGLRFNVRLLDQNQLFIRKWNRDFYRRIPGNEDDHRIYKQTCCRAEKPGKFDQDRRRKYVADWHCTPSQYRWHREYE